MVNLIIPVTPTIRSFAGTSEIHHSMQNSMGYRMHIFFSLGKRRVTISILEKLPNPSKTYSKPDYILYTDYPFVCRDFKNTPFDAELHGLSDAYLVLSRQTKTQDQYR